MPEVERHDQGTFSWADLGTTDPAAATRFCTALFGWSAEEVPAGEAGTYTLLRLNDREVAALYEMEAEQREAGGWPHLALRT
jgi:predicted enzyme related to lactoylglutathione lyase